VEGIDKVSTYTMAVKNENEALRWFIEKLGFEKRVIFLDQGYDG
jgi:hypothetical protein